MDHSERGTEPQVTREELRAALAAGSSTGSRRRRGLVDAPAPGGARAWDWEADLSEPDRTELSELRAVTAGLRSQLAELQRAVEEGRRREREVREALARLAAARPWRRRRLLAELRSRCLLD